MKPELLRPLWASLASALMLSACTTFPPEEGRVDRINKSTNDYASQATLLNVLRAEHQEPLAFIAITGMDQANSLSGQIGFGGFGFGPHLSANPRNFLLGPDSLTRSGSNTVHVSVVDDPASYVALLSPVTPATIAFFQNEGYQRELLFFLLVDRMRETKPGAAGGHPTVTTYINDPTDPTKFPAFIGVMASLLKAGLVAEIDVTATPSGRSLPKSALCFDRTLPTPAFAKAADKKTTSQRKVALDAIALTPDSGACENAVWVEASPSAGAAPSTPTASQNPISTAADGSAWIMLSGRSKVRHLLVDGTFKDYDAPEAPKPTPKPPSIAYPLKLQDGTTYDIHLRSVYGVYAYLGAVRRGPNGQGTDIANLLQLDESGQGGLLNITPGRDKCFTAIEFKGSHYCVPEDASNTKQLFSLLHQLQQVSTAPSNAPTTLTVTNLP